ncbi:type II secretion system protein GspJ [Zoogloea ramigera]|uniref:Type II secretion system protein J n=1 Tax=Zoogloea ramigera TaxID=350 RepID=A0A4Y4CT35_ZOORA|nr:type II secretion system minor pseudopilin GspJ [Zoogloea ramigera]GEC94413.1 type II secretion system protein GspJ [Zoogloea ramigera]
MSAPQPAHRQRGLTLIELMVALAIFAVLGVLSYRALAEVSTSRTRLEEGFERWRSIGRAMQRIDTDLLQLVAPATSSSPTTSAQASPPLLLTRAASGGAELQLLRLDEARGVRRVGYRLVDGRLDWLRWSGRDAFGEPTVEPLLGNVRNVRWRFLTGGNRVDAWPPGDRRGTLPDAVILELELPDHGTLTRFIALR